MFRICGVGHRGSNGRQRSWCRRYLMAIIFLTLSLIITISVGVNLSSYA